ncbi:hypothetical protein AUK40_05475 [Candidatus Wirthbacteria bacterium CG2_30_54_11]|uniref:Methyltransferase domain-containing protein n=1 Tax=Candidatus Wirthbacteria bacterium CG2_30_54_11 TaxID=1817892 RepID=A0A1J5IFY4_9BACT|nr:MAG: hypothetical protein AUK40_05475 [Candidatus Wirthbacteria bacterium CG2_30_54_11]
MPELVLLIIFCVLFLPLVYSSIVAAPPVPTKAGDVRRMVDLGRISPTDTVYDLGAGDGRLLLGAARFSKASALIGYELSPVHVLICRLKTLLSGQAKRVSIRMADFYKADLRDANVIFCFLNPYALERLRPKFETELNKGTRIVSYSFPVAGWSPVAEDRPDTDRLPIFVYER